TDKVDAETLSPAAGTLTEVKVAEGETVQINTVVAIIGDGAAAAAPAPPPAAPPTPPAAAPPTPAAAAPAPVAAPTPATPVAAPAAAPSSTDSGPGTEIPMP